ncbi:MAG: hypothetical protein P8J77_03725 [Flavobacteriales bacterium]|nr:hypothetical protein [Flavobacteriales bacterium]
MGNIETPLTLGLGILALVLITLSALNNTEADYNISSTSTDVNNGFNLAHEHATQEASSFTIANPDMTVVEIVEIEEAATDSTLVEGENTEEENLEE